MSDDVRDSVVETSIADEGVSADNNSDVAEAADSVVEYSSEALEDAAVDISISVAVDVSSSLDHDDDDSVI